MNSTKGEKYLSKQRAEWVKKYREITPVMLKPIDTRSSNRPPVTAGLEPYDGEWGDIQKLHLLKRTLFGVRKSDLQQIRNLSLLESLALLTDPVPVPAPPVNNYNNPAEDIQDPHVEFGETWIFAPYGSEYEGHRTSSLKSWLVDNIIRQPTHLEEKMVFFWHNLLSIQTWGVFHGRLSYQYFEMLRRNAFGNYRTLIRQLTLDPAMLLFLNGTFNHKDAPDENYGRELQELFCIGKGPEAKFTESDVRSAARVLTGWMIDWEQWESPGTMEGHFQSWAHDTSDKEFSSFYGNRVITGRSGDEGAEELDELLDMIFENQETAKYICRRLYRFFVYHQIDQTTEEQVIEPLAKIFRDNDYEIKPVLNALFSSNHFFDHANIGAMIKSPADYLLGLWRTFEMTGVDTSDLLMGFSQNLSFLSRMASQGLAIGDPPSVAGWPAYYQEPSFDKYWITTDTITSRGYISDAMVWWGLWVSPGIEIPADLIQFLQLFDNPVDPNEMLQEAGRLVLGIDLDEATLTNLKTTLLSGQQSDGYWATAWTSLIAEPDNEEYRQVVENRLKPTFQQLLQLGEAQLM